jgi:hypothetical protein
MKQALPSGPVTTPSGTAPKPSRRAFLPLILGVIIAFSAINMLLHRENRYEKLATDVTKALAANNMQPVEKEFNALRRPELEERGKVGQLSDFVNEDGALKRIKEDTPSGAKAGYHHFIAEFDKGSRSEDLTVDSDGKIADFHVRPLESK